MYDYSKNRIFSSFIKSQFTYIRLIWMFCTKHSLVELAAYMNDACALFNKTTPLISKYFLKVQIENHSTKNADNFLWLSFMNTWMAYLLISWVKSLNSEKVSTIWEIFIYLNFRIPEQKSLAETILYIQLVKIFLRKLEIQPHFLYLRRK